MLNKSVQKKRAWYLPSAHVPTVQLLTIPTQGQLACSLQNERPQQSTVTTGIVTTRNKQTFFWTCE